MEQLSITQNWNTGSSIQGELKVTNLPSEGKLLEIRPNGTSNTTTFINTYSTLERISVHEVGESIEIVYKETSMNTLAVYPHRQPDQRVFKVVYSVKDGKWHKSERIYGDIIPASPEYYEF